MLKVTVLTGAVIAFVTVTGIIAQTQPVRAQTATHVGPAELYPNPKLTPGKYDTLAVDDLTAWWTGDCPKKKKYCTYSQSHRDVSASVHKKAYDNYKVPAAFRNIEDGEVDHFHPLCAGGSNDIKNLWYQPAEVEWNGQNFGYHEKDDLETWVCEQI